MCWTLINFPRIQYVFPIIMLIATYYNSLSYDCLQNQMLALQDSGSVCLFCSLYAQHLVLDLPPGNTSINICRINEGEPEECSTQVDIK